ncbi:MAG: (2Fe-2S)-binding protein [Blastocatellia bacterium]|nr:(2Fe-2S)-binding protein [Blastocatellia bacterium]
MSNNVNHFSFFLKQQSDADWAGVINDLPIHPVDRRATRIWFAFFPLKLQRALSTNPEEKAKDLLLKGKYLLAEQVDSSAEFLYGHRYWPDVKRVVAEYAATSTSAAPLAAQIREVARRLAAKANTEESLLTGITAVAFATLQQVGYDAFSLPAQPGAYGEDWKKSPAEIVKERERDDGQGALWFLKTVDKEFTVNFREYEPGCTFKIMNMQDVTMAASFDKRPHHLRDERCLAGEGPIPVECRTSSCGTCWVGVLSPTEKISPPSEREISRWRYFGYQGFTGGEDSPIRLACQMKAYGNVTIVIPPWNGLIGKLDEGEESEAA